MQLFLNLSLVLLLFDVDEPLSCRCLDLHHIIFRVVPKLNFPADDHCVHEFSEPSSAEKTLDHLSTTVFLCLSDDLITSFGHRVFGLLGHDRFFGKFPGCLVQSHCFEQILPQDSDANPPLNSDNRTEGFLLLLD